MYIHLNKICQYQRWNISEISHFLRPDSDPVPLSSVGFFRRNTWWNKHCWEQNSTNQICFSPTCRQIPWPRADSRSPPSSPPQGCRSHPSLSWGPATGTEATCWWTTVGPWRSWGRTRGWFWDCWWSPPSRGSCCPGTGFLAETRSTAGNCSSESSECRQPEKLWLLLVKLKWVTV